MPNRWWNRLKALCSFQENGTAELQVTGDSAWIVSPGRENIEIKTSEVSELVAFKRDLLTEDMICVRIRHGSPDKERQEEINEDMRGFEDAMAHPAWRLAGFDLHWRESVVKPAFAANPTVVYHKSPDNQP